MERLNQITQYLRNYYPQLKIDEEALSKAVQKNSFSPSDLAVNILSITGAIFSVFSFLGFLFLLNIYDSPTTLFFLGAIFITSSIAISYQVQKLFLDTVSISLFCAGLVMVGSGLGLQDATLNSILLIILGISSIPLAIKQTKTLTFFSFMILNACVLGLILTNKAYSLIPIYITIIASLLSYFCYYEGRMLTSNSLSRRLYSVIRIGLICSLVLSLVLITHARQFNMTIPFIWCTSLVLIVLNLIFAHRILLRHEITNRKKQWMFFVGFSILLFPTIYAPYISGAILLILLNYSIYYKTGLLIGGLCLCYSLVHYYYDLELSLLYKSGLLCLSGSLLLLYYALLSRKIKRNEKI